MRTGSSHVSELAVLIISTVFIRLRSASSSPLISRDEQKRRHQWSGRRCLNKVSNREPILGRYEISSGQKLLTRVELYLRRIIVSRHRQQLCRRPASCYSYSTGGGNSSSRRHKSLCPTYNASPSAEAECEQQNEFGRTAVDQHRRHRQAHPQAVCVSRLVQGHRNVYSYSLYFHNLRVIQGRVRTFQFRQEALQAVRLAAAKCPVSVKLKLCRHPEDLRHSRRQVDGRANS